MFSSFFFFFYNNFFFKGSPVFISFEDFFFGIFFFFTSELRKLLWIFSINLDNFQANYFFNFHDNSLININALCNIPFNFQKFIINFLGDDYFFLLQSTQLESLFHEFDFNFSLLISFFISIESLDLFFYFFILSIFVLFFLGLLIFLIPFTFFLDQNSYNKRSPYECGINPFTDSREPMEVLFYVISILYILFDLEIILLLPVFLVFNSLSFSSIIMVFFFLGFLGLGFIYEWQRCALE